MPTPDASKADVQATEFQQDQILGGRYRVLCVLGRGGMGVVYKVEQIFLGKELALKTIANNMVSATTVRRFQHEAKAAFAVNHPNIIAVHDFGLLDDQTPFLVMEIVTGKTLAARLKEGVLGIDDTLAIFIQVCFGLAHAHENGVIHRDVKPTNIMLLDRIPLGDEGSVKILDFGIAKLMHHEEGEIQALTKTGEIFGSPLYMSPEQCAGGKVDHRSDIYSLGCVLFEALTGSAPFVGENALSTMIMHQSAPAPSLKEASLGAEFPPALELIVKGLLAKEPNDRYQNLGKVAHDLAAIKRGESSRYVPAVKAPERQSQSISTAKTITMRRDLLAGLLIASAIVGAGVASAVIYTWPKQHREKPAPAIEQVTVPSAAESNSDAQSFAGAIARRACRFHSNMIATDQSMAAFKHYKEAQEVDLLDSFVTDSGIANLTDSKVLRLKLCRCDIKSVDNIVKLTYLQELDLRETAIDDAALAKLAGLKMLKKLNIEGCSISQNGLLPLASAPSLEWLGLTEGKYSPSFITNELARKMPQCQFEHYSRRCQLEEIDRSYKGKDLLIRASYLMNILERANPELSRIGDFLIQMATIRAGSGALDEAARLSQRAADHYEKIGDFTDLAGALRLQASIAARQGNLKKALALNDRRFELTWNSRFHDDAQFIASVNDMADIPMQAKNYSKAKSYYQVVIDLIERFPSLDRELLPDYYERAGWCCYLMNDLPAAKTYFEKDLAFVKAHGNHDRKQYARALIEVAHCSSETKKRKALYDEGLNELDALGLPEELDLKEHYCDACLQMAVLCDQEGNRSQSIMYLKRALAAVKQMKHPDYHDRRRVFEEQLARRGVTRQMIDNDGQTMKH